MQSERVDQLKHPPYLRQSVTQVRGLWSKTLILRMPRRRQECSSIAKANQKRPSFLQPHQPDVREPVKTHVANVGFA